MENKFYVSFECRGSFGGVEIVYNKPISDKHDIQALQKEIARELFSQGVGIVQSDVVILNWRRFEPPYEIKKLHENL
jgi:hypothetical protein